MASNWRHLLNHAHLILWHFNSSHANLYQLHLQVRTCFCVISRKSLVYEGSGDVLDSRSVQNQCHHVAVCIISPPLSSTCPNKVKSCLASVRSIRQIRYMQQPQRDHNVFLFDNTVVPNPCTLYRTTQDKRNTIISTQHQTDLFVNEFSKSDKITLYPSHSEILHTATKQRYETIDKRTAKYFASRAWDGDSSCSLKENDISRICAVSVRKAADFATKRLTFRYKFHFAVSEHTKK